MGKDKKIEILGIFSGILTTLAFLPQVIKVWNAYPKPVESVSLLTFLMFCTGLIGWIAYGWLKKSLAVKLANIATLFFSLLILVYKLIYG